MNDHAKEGPSNQRVILIALTITAAFLVVEFVGALLTNSLALLADAGHMLSDVAALSLSLFAFRMAERPTTPAKTYGYYRVEILVALVNGVTLVGVAVLVTFEALQRFQAPPHVDSLPMLGIAAFGLVANLASALALHRNSAHNLNVRAAFLHVLSDALGSVGAMVAAGVMLLTGQFLADPIVSLVIAVLVIWGAWRLLRETVDVLLEATPPHVDLPTLEAAMRRVEGVESVHDLHVWTVTSGFAAMTAHVEVEDACDRHGVLMQLRDLVQQQCGICHVTIQIEEQSFEEELHHR